MSVCVYCCKSASEFNSVWLINDVDMTHDEQCHHKCIQNMLQIKNYIGMIRRHCDQPMRYGGNMTMYANALAMYQKDCAICHTKNLAKKILCCYSTSGQSIDYHKSCLRKKIVQYLNTNELIGIRKYNDGNVIAPSWNELSPVLKGGAKRALVQFKKNLQKIANQQH